MTKEDRIFFKEFKIWLRTPGPAYFVSASSEDYNECLFITKKDQFWLEINKLIKKQICFIGIVRIDMPLDLKMKYYDYETLMHDFLETRKIPQTELFFGITEGYDDDIFHLSKGIMCFKDEAELACALRKIEP